MLSFFTLVIPTEDNALDHSTATLLSGRHPLVPIGLPVLVGDRLFNDRTDSVTREDNC